MTPSPNRSIRPAVHRIGPLSLAPDIIRVLPNGVTLHIVDNGPNEVCRLGIALPGGQAESPIPGVYDAVSSLLPEGSLHTPGTGMAETLETNGAWVVPTVSTHHTLINIFSLCSVLPTILPLAREMAFEPAMEDDAVARTLRMLSSRTAVQQCKVNYRAAKAIAPLIYGPENPLSASIQPDEVLSFTPPQLREAHMRRLDFTGTHIFLAGKVSAEMVDAVEREFGSISNGTRFPLTTLEFPAQPQGGEVYVDMPDSLQSAVRLAIPMPGRSHPDFLKMRIAACALGGYFGSRLMANIREDKGLTYGINAAIYGYPDNGFLIISTETACDNVEAIISECVSEIERLKDPSTFSADEIERLTSHLLSSLAAVLDTPFQRMDFLQSTVISGTPSDYFARRYEADTSITPESIAATAASFFDTGLLVTSVAGKQMRRT
ncbi:MAG: insulinase family protein [Muribaculaceae bacterium]|nr:insulinase family protein [Muribaculaceae bacterium]